jgi:hypothetical protein
MWPEKLKKIPFYNNKDADTCSSAKSPFIIMNFMLFIFIFGSNSPFGCPIATVVYGNFTGVAPA